MKEGGALVYPQFDGYQDSFSTIVQFMVEEHNVGFSSYRIAQRPNDSGWGCTFVELAGFLGDSVLFADSSVRPSDHRQRFIDGKRTRWVGLFRYAEWELIAHSLGLAKSVIEAQPECCIRDVGRGGDASR